MIEIESLTKKFLDKHGDETIALNDVSITISDNEFLTVLGPSGCGKTTLLRAVAGLTDYTSGSITVDGRPVTGPGPDRAMVFQNFALLPWLNVLENISFGLKLNGSPRQQRMSRAEELVKLVGLTGSERKLPGELSGGMQQRVGLARALAVEPRVLLMDEPFGALDEQTRRILQEQLLTIWEKRRITVIFITHSIEEAVLLGDRVVLMTPRPGRIQKIVDVPLARPRVDARASMTGAKELAAITADLWGSLRKNQPAMVPEGGSI